MFQPDRICILLEQDAAQIAGNISLRSRKTRVYRLANGWSNTGIQHLEARADGRVGMERIDAQQVPPKGFDKAMMSVFRCVCKPVY